MFRFLISLIGLGLVLTGPALAQTRGLFMLTPTDTKQPVTIYQKSYALVIGIDRYTGGWPRLSNAVADAKAVAAELTERNFDVTTVLNPGSAELRRRLEDFIFDKGRDRSARLFIWFAGHGHTVDGEGYLAPADAPITPAWKFRRNAFSLRSFGRLMREAKSKHVLAVFDSCFAGTVFNTVRSLPSKAITRATTLPVRQFVSSGEAKQEVSDDGSFRKLFIDALRGDEVKADANGDGFITGTEVGLFLSDKVTNLTEGKQTPRYGKLRSLGLDRGEFVFRSRAAALMATKPRRAPTFSQQAELTFWHAVKDSKDPDIIRTYLSRFPKGIYVPIARVLLDKLKKRSEKATFARLKQEELRAAEEKKRRAEAARRKAQRRQALAKQAEELRKLSVSKTTRPKNQQNKKRIRRNAATQGSRRGARQRRPGKVVREIKKKRPYCTVSHGMMDKRLGLCRRN
jgi:Caspase domain